MQRYRRGVVAYLRVYEPLSALPDAERSRWERYVAQGATFTREQAAIAEHEAGLRAAVRQNLDVDVEHALVLRVDGRVLICPLRTQLRVWAAAERFRDALPPLVADAFLPACLVEGARRERSRFRTASPRAKIYVQASASNIPISWFLAFDGHERALVLERARGTAVRQSSSLTYLTMVGQARRRVARALTVLRRTLPDSPNREMVEELGEWLEEFSPGARLELDYGGIADLLPDDVLRDDTSAADLQEAVLMLRDGNPQEAGERYVAVLERLRRVQSLELVN